MIIWQGRLPGSYCNGCETFYFHGYFKKGAPDNNKKQQLNDLLKFFSARNKKVLIRKKDSDKKFRDEYESTTQNTWFKMLFSYFRFFAIPCCLAGWLVFFLTRFWTLLVFWIKKLL